MLLSFLRTMFLYLVLIAAVRLMGKRQIGQMEPAEFVVTMLIANLAAIPMQDGGISLFSGLSPVLTVLGMQLVLAVASLRWISFRRLLCGKPVILIAEGKIQQDNLRRTRLTLDELSEHLRQQGALDMSTVQYAILETNGQVSVFRYPEEEPAPAKAAGVAVPAQSLPVTVVSDGRILEDNLTRADRNRAWLGKELQRQGCPLRRTLLLTVDGQGKVYFVKKEGKP